MQSRSLVFKSAAGVKARTETYNGREHIVVPVVALVQGVVHAMNAKNPELVPADEIRPAGWDGRPIFVGHPLVNGQAVSGNSPDILESKSVGIVFNTRMKSKKLTMEAWIDKEKADEVDPKLLERVANGDPIEISVGIFCETDDVAGTFEGKKYTGAWHDIVPDHLALLPEGDEGACSREMGCGVRAAAKQETPMSVKKSPSVIGKFLAMFRAAQPAEEMSDSDLRKKLSDALREKVGSTFMYIEAFVPVIDPNRVVYTCWEQLPSMPEMGMGYSGYCMYETSFTLDANGLVTLGDAVVEVEAVLSYQPVLMAQEPTIAESGEAEVKDAKGARNSKSDQEKIQGMHDHAVALGAYCDPKVASGQKNAAAGAPCSCQSNAPSAHQGVVDMTSKEKIAKFLETATEEQAAEYAAKAEATPAAAAPAAAAATVVVEPAVAPTFETLMAAAPADVQDSFNEGLRVGRAKKEATIKALKDTGRCSYSDEELSKLKQSDLDRLVALAGSNVRAAIDYSGQGVSRPTSEAPAGAPAPPDLGDAIRAARAGK